MARAALPLPSQAFLRQCLIYKPRLGVLVWRRRPREHFPTEIGWKIFNSKCAGKTTGSVYRGRKRIRIGDALFLTSRVAWMMMTGEDPGLLQVDHKNTIRSDDRWRNLRLATNGQNRQNTISNKNTSGYKGASRNGKGWQANIRSDNIQHYLGTYDTPEQAHAAYRAAAKRLHGDFARIS